jgi:uncharacterized protein DUF4349
MSPEMTTEELMVELHELRETPSLQFAARLDRRAEAGFPRGGRAAGTLERLRTASPRRMLLPALGTAATLIVVATAVIATSGDGGNDGSRPSAQTEVQAAPSSGAAGAVGGAAKASPGAGVESAPMVPTPDSETFTDSTGPKPPVGVPNVRDRRIERSAELTLGTDPEHVQDIAGKVFDVVGRYRGIVLSSSVRDGGEGEAGASFEVLIPSARLSGALTDLSGLAEVRSRSENTLDITAPYVSARERLRDARAEVEGLLRQLASADTDSERASVKAQLRIAHGRVAAFRSQVDRLQRRSDFSHLSLDIATGKDAFVPATGGNDDWTIGDALADAGRLLAIAAGVALVSLALALPLGLLGGAAWAGRRIYVRRARQGALGA